MFVDKAQVNIAAGNGGDGIVSFRHEIYRPQGGPDGGNGGNGGDVILVASRNQNTLAAFRYKKLIKAQDGQNGGANDKHGRSAPSLRVEVPVGTVVLDEDQKMITDLSIDGQEAVIAKGGQGGFGNAHFTSSVRQAPRISDKGEKGERFNYVLELRMIADVGLVGLPNAGKSSLLTAISNARPEIASYPFTTLQPHLGVVDIGGDAFLMADIPGLIEGASQGKGLGDEFLRHVSRCSVLVHLIDVNSNDIAKDYKIIRQELAAYSKELAKKPEVIALTKTDSLDAELVEMQMASLKEALPSKTQVFALSAYAKKGLNELLFYLLKLVVKERAKQLKIDVAKQSALPVIGLKEVPEAWKIKKEDHKFTITGRKIERFAAKVDFNSDIGQQRIKDIMKKMGIIRQLKRDGITSDDKIAIGHPPIGEVTY